MHAVMVSISLAVQELSTHGRRNATCNIVEIMRITSVRRAFSGFDLDKNTLIFYIHCAVHKWVKYCVLGLRTQV